MQPETLSGPDGHRRALGHYASGLTVITGADGQGLIGFTCQSFHSVSLTPPLVSFTVSRTSASWPRIGRSGKFAVNVLSTAQRELSDRFAARGADRWAGVSWLPTSTGNPVLPSSLLWLDCDVVAQHDAGDHVIVLGQVVETGPPPGEDLEPLLFYRGAYRELSSIGSHVSGLSGTPIHQAGGA